MEAAYVRLSQGYDYCKQSRVDDLDGLAEIIPPPNSPQCVFLADSFTAS